MQTNLVMALAAALALGACAIGGDDGRPDGELRGSGIGGEDSEPAADSEGVRLDLPVVGSSTGDGSTGGSSGSTDESSTGAGVDDGSTGGDTAGSSSTGTSSTGGEDSTGNTSNGGSTGGSSSTGDEPEPEPEPPPPDFCGDGQCTGDELVPACWEPGWCPGDCLKQPKCLSDCPCSPGITTFCNLAPGTCSATKPGGYCDPNGDGAFFDGDFTKGNLEHAAKCG